MSRKGNWEQGSFRDQWDNERMRSLDRGDRTGAPTNIPISDDFDPLTADYFPDHGEAFHRGRQEPRRDHDLSLGRSGNTWNEGIHYRARGEIERKHQGKGPRGYLKSDEALKEDVCLVLHQSHEVDASNMEVSVEDRCVYLKGSIASRGMKSVAEDLVSSIPGVVDVFTQLQIEQRQ